MERAARESRATTSADPDGGFRSFVAAVSEALTRLAYVLTVGLPGEPAAGVLAANALAQVRRQWRDVEAAGLPEQLAADALLSAVLKRHARPQSLAPRSVGPRSVEPSEAGVADDQQVLLEACWRAFVTLAPRRRAAVVFIDPSVAAHRLAGLDAPPSLGSPRRQATELAAAIDALRTVLRADAVVIDHPAIAAVEAISDEQLTLLTGDSIRAHAASAPAVFDPNTEVDGRVRQLHRRGLLVGALVVAVIAATGVSAVIASAPTRVASRTSTSTTAPETAASSAISSSAPAPAQVRPPFTDVAVEPPADPDQSVVPWPARGSLADEPVLLARIEAAFSQSHPDATTRPQVLLVTDTPAFRLAYLVARTPDGVLGSWFTAPTGSADLRESFAGYGDDIDATSAIAAHVHWASGARVAGAGSASPRELVIIAPPTTPSIEVFDAVVGTRAPASVPLNDGVAVEVVRPDGVAASPTQINVSTDTYAVAGIPDIELDPSKSYATGDAKTQPAVPVPTVTVERGRPDPALLADALLVAEAWAPTDPSAVGAPAVSATPVLLWGGTDTIGTKLVVARVHGIPYDLLVLEWSGDAPGLHGEVLVRATSPEVPVAFAYRSAQGTRIGIIAETADKAVALAFGGKQSPTVMFDADGFASIPLSGAGGLPNDANVNASPPPSNEFSGLIDATVAVELYGWDDQVRGFLNVPPAL